MRDAGLCVGRRSELSGVHNAIAIVPKTCWVVQHHKFGASDVAWVILDSTAF
jgi:hypothetical protein